MRTATALVLGTLLPLMGLAGIGEAQSSVQVEGTIQAVDCQAETVVLSSPSASNTIAAAPYTAVLVNSTSVPLCALQQYIGAPATAWLVANGNEFLATRIDVSAVAVAAPAPPTVVAAPLPLAGIVLGTIVVAGLAYLLVRDHDGRFYRYPYYGSYHRFYYRPEYRPYHGPYPDAPVRLSGSHGYAPVLPRDRRWDPPGRPNPGNHVLARPDTPARWTPPASQGAPDHVGRNWNPPAPPNDRRWQPPEQWNRSNRLPADQGSPARWTPPASRGGPAHVGRNWNPPAPPNDRRWQPPEQRNRGDRYRDARRNDQPLRRCEGRADRGCGDRGPANR